MRAAASGLLLQASWGSHPQGWRPHAGRPDIGRDADVRGRGRRWRVRDETAGPGATGPRRSCRSSRYLQAFATASKGVSERVYLDAFAGEGLGIDRLTGEEFKGSARIASDVADPAFTQALSSPDRHAWGQGRPGLIN